MAWTDPRDWSTGEVVTAALMNSALRDNLNVTSAGVVTTAGDIAYASAAHTMARVGKGTNGNILHQASCAPAWTATPSITSLTLSGDLTVSGGCIVLTGAATDVDLIDNNACALSFDASGQAGILAIDTQNCAEGVKMSGKLTVTGATTTTGTVTVGVDDTGHDVKFFGASAGAFLLYNESCDLLEIRGATAAGPGHLKLTTGEATVVACDVLGKIEFQAPAECGTDAIVAGASIQAVAQATFTASVNNTDLLFLTGLSGAASEKFRVTANGELGVGGANYGTDGQVLTSTGAGTAPAWEDAGGVSLSGSTNNTVATVTGSDALIGEANLQFDGTNLGIGVAGDHRLTVRQAGTGDANGMAFQPSGGGHSMRLKLGACNLFVMSNGGNGGLTINTAGRVNLGATESGIAKGWGWITAAGGLSSGSYNVASVTDTGTGDRSVVWATDFGDALYVTLGAVVDQGYTNGQINESTKAACQVRLAVNDTESNALADFAHNFAAFGDQ